MILSAALALMMCATSAACGKVYAHMKGLENEDMYVILGAFLPPLGVFFAISILLKEYEE